MILKFLFSIILAIASFVLMKMMSGGWWTSFIDLPNILLIGIIPLMYQLILFGGKNFKNAFSAPLNKESSPTEVSRALDFFKAYNKSIWIFAAATVLIGVISMMKNLDDPNALGPNMVIAFMSFLYAALINLFLILPYITITKQRLTNNNINL
jgi:flagellar motor component MotA